MIGRSRGRNRYERRSQARARRIQRRLDQVQQTRTTSGLPKRLRGPVPRRSRSRAMRVAFFLGSLALGMLLALTGTGTALLWWHDQPVVLDSIAVQGNERLSGAAVAAATGLAKGSALDALPDGFREAVEASVTAHPWIRSARVAVLPTGTLIVDVEERRPRAVVREAEDNRWRFVDAEGVAFAQVSGHEVEAGALPALARSEKAPEPTSEAASEPLLRDGLVLLHHLNSLSLPGFAWGETPHRGFELRLPVTDSGRGWVLFGHALRIEVILGSDDIATVIDRLDRLERLLSAGLEEIARTHVIDMRFAGQAVLQGTRASG